MQKILLLALLSGIAYYLPAQSMNNVKAFSLPALQAEQATTNKAWHQYVDEPSLFSGLYKIPVNGKDLQKPHEADEIYYLLKGKAKLKAGDKDAEVQPGDVIYVRAEVEHYFHTVTEELLVLVFFAKAKPVDTDPASAFFKAGDITRKNNTDSSTIFTCHTLSVDIRTGETKKEINIPAHTGSKLILFISGSGTLQVGDAVTTLSKDSVLFVPGDTGITIKTTSHPLQALVMTAK